MFCPTPHHPPSLIMITHPQRTPITSRITITEFASRCCLHLHNRRSCQRSEHLAMPLSILQNMYIDEQWVAHEYLCICKRNKWKKASDDDALTKYYNCERILDADLIYEVILHFNIRLQLIVLVTLHTLQF